MHFTAATLSFFSYLAAGSRWLRFNNYVSSMQLANDSSLISWPTVVLAPVLAGATFDVAFSASASDVVHPKFPVPPTERLVSERKVFFFYLEEFVEKCTWSDVGVVFQHFWRMLQVLRKLVPRTEGGKSPGNEVLIAKHSFTDTAHKKAQIHSAQTYYTSKPSWQRQPNEALLLRNSSSLRSCFSSYRSIVTVLQLSLVRCFIKKNAL